ncbi:MAG: ATP-binding protein [Planctomycetota bacterium]
MTPIQPYPATLEPQSFTEPAIVLHWLVRLRWLAALGQLLAIGLAIWLLGLGYGWTPLAVVVAVTLVSNVLLAAALPRLPDPPRSLAAGVVLADVLLLTTLLFFTGGAANPFTLLYVLHVALAASVLGSRWTWIVVGLVGVCFGFVALVHRPLEPTSTDVLEGDILLYGQAMALLLVVLLVGYFVSRVVASLRQREAELARVREEAQVGERLAAITTLAAGAAHELGTPLATIAVTSREMELAAEKLGDDALAEDATLVRQQVERCRQILEHLRGDVAGRGTDEPGESDVQACAEAVRDRLRPGRREKVIIDFRSPVHAAVAPRALEQALELLVNNAFQAGEAAGIDGPVEIDAIQDPFAARVSVIDIGPGMAPEVAARAAEPFFTTKDPGGGMGLGLFLVRLIAEKAGGSFKLNSEVGKGTIATLALPPIPDPNEPK